MKEMSPQQEYHHDCWTTVLKLFFKGLIALILITSAFGLVTTTIANQHERFLKQNTFVLTDGKFSCESPPEHAQDCVKAIESRPKPSIADAFAEENHRSIFPLLITILVILFFVILITMFVCSARKNED